MYGVFIGTFFSWQRYATTALVNRCNSNYNFQLVGPLEKTRSSKNSWTDMNAREILDSFKLTQPRGLTQDELQPFLDEIGLRNMVDADDFSNSVNIFITVEEDPMFGAILSFSYGHLAQDIWEDVTYRILPIDSTEARRLIVEPKAAKFLAGYGNYVRPNRELLITLLEQISNLIDQLPEIVQMELELSFLSSNDIAVRAASIFCNNINQNAERKVK